MRSLNLRRAAITVGLIFADWFFINAADGRWPLRWIDDVLWRYGGSNVGDVAGYWAVCGAVLLPVLTVLAVVAFGVRLVARQRLRASGADPFEPIRRWVARRRWTVRAICAVPAAVFALNGHILEQAIRLLVAGLGLLGPDDGGLGPHTAWRALTILGLGVVGPVLGVAAALRVFLGAVLSPLVDDAELARTDAGGFYFSAVAVTPEARAAVGLFALVTAVVLGTLAEANVGASAIAFPLALSYGAGALLAALSFQRASRIAVGLDGVRVGGSSLRRFRAYRDLDGVEVTRAGDVLLQRQGKVVLRLQLHGEDAARRGPIVERLREAIARAHAPGNDARRLAEAVSAKLLAQAARGDGDYRSPAASRDALWEVVEAPSASGEARARAAHALAAEADGADRARLRFAAERCADVPTRGALSRIVEELGDEEALGDEGAEARPRRGAMRAAGR